MLGGGGRRVKLDLRNDEDKVPLAAGFEGKSSMSDVSCTVEEGGEKTGVESDERQSPHSLPGGFTGLARIPTLMVVLQPFDSVVSMPGHDSFLESKF